MKKKLLLALMALLPLVSWAVSADLTTTPTLTPGLVYDGTQKTLLSGSAVLPADYFITPGCVVYQVTNADVAPNIATELQKVGGETTAFPTATNAGMYYVWYKVKADDALYDEDGDWTKIGGTFVRISPATPIITEPTAATLTYTGAEQALLTASGSADWGTLTYSMNNIDYYAFDNATFTAACKGINATNYTVYLKVEADATNGNWVEATQTMDVAIAPKDLDDEDVTITYNPAAALVYTGAAQALNIADITVTWTGHDAPVATTDFVISAYDDNTNAGTHTCTLAPGASGNFKDGSFQFTIGQKSIADASVVVTPADVIYKGRTITQADLVTAGLTIKDGTLPNLVPSTAEEVHDFSLTTEARNVNAGTTTSTVTITGSGNYTGSRTANFKVTPAELTVNAANVNVACLTTVTDDVLAGHYTLTGWLGDDATADPKPAVTGAPVIANTGNTAAVGTQDDVISITGVGTLATANYTFAVGAAADLIVEAIPLTIAFKENVGTFYYKDVVPAFDDLAAIKANYVNISAPEAVTAMTIKMYDAEDHEVVAGTELTVGETYTLKVTAETHNVNYLLTGEIANKSITVQKLPIIIKAGDQNIAYNGGESAGPQLAKNLDLNADEVYDTWTGAILTICDAEGVAYDKATFTGKYAVWTENFVNTLTWSKAADYSIAEPGNVVVNLLDAYDSDHFIVTTDNGDVAWTDVETTITLARTDAGAENLIKEYDGATGITVQFASRKLKKEQWYALVLPFPTSVTELSSKLGYAVVNILNQNNNDPAKMQFRLHMGDIAANQPFLVKVYNDAADDKGKDLADITFTAKTITYSANPYDEDPAGNKLIGVYKTTDLDANPNLWVINGGTFNKLAADATLKPIVAYLETATVQDAFAPSIFVEDFDGTVTAINGINVDRKAVSAEGWYTLNGVKLNAAPTQKGIYINNGKKIVIK